MQGINVNYMIYFILTWLTLATLRGIGVTLNPKGGGQNLPFRKHRLYELAQIFSMVDLFFSI